MPRRRTIRRGLTLLLVLALAIGGTYIAISFVQRSETLVMERCTAVAGNLQAELATDQARNAALISAVAVQRGLPPRAASIALATAMQESKLRNIDYGDEAGPDSQGLFQQRPSQGWGTSAQVMDPYYAANAFYDALVEIPGYEDMPITDAAQLVQRSAYPTAYAAHEDMGRAFASGLTGQAAASVECTLRSPDSPADATEVVAALEAGFGGVETEKVDGAVHVTTPHAWAVAHWAVASAKDLGITAVTVDGYTWDRAGRDGWQQTGAGSSSTVTIGLAAADGT